jgi:diacylglycerol kinase family enzyme
MRRREFIALLCGAAAEPLVVRAQPTMVRVGILQASPAGSLQQYSAQFRNGLSVTVETNPELKRRLGGLAYVLTGISRFAELSANRGAFRAEGFSWEGRFVAVAIGNGRQAGGGVPLCPDAMIDDGHLDLMILPELDHAARLEAFSHLLMEGAAGIRAGLVRTRSSWIEYESDDDLNVNLDGEPTTAKRFRVECRERVLPVRLGQSALLRKPVGRA